MIKVIPSVLHGEIEAPASRAHAIRLLIAAALSNSTTTIENVPDCTDIDVVIDVLRDLGCQLTVSGEDRFKVVIKPFAKNMLILDGALNFGESGTTARIITAVLGALGIQASCRAQGRLIQRDQKPLTTAMALRGASFSSFSYPLVISGKLRGGDYAMSGENGSQFISALLMALPLVWEDSTITLTSPIRDRSFIYLTMEVLKEFGIEIKETEKGFYIPGKQKYKTPKQTRVQGSWQTSAMWALAGSLCSKKGGFIKVNGLNAGSSLAFKDFEHVMALMVQDYTTCGFSCKESAELISLYTVLASAHGGESFIFGVPGIMENSHGHFKKVKSVLEQLGTEIQATEDGIVVRRDTSNTSVADLVIDCEGRAWAFMSLVVASSVMDVPLVFKDQHGADKVYKSFLKDFVALGGQYEVI